MMSLYGKKCSAYMCTIVTIVEDAIQPDVDFSAENIRFFRKMLAIASIVNLIDFVVCTCMTGIDYDFQV